ncbi:MAG TPA: tandem-95 repeat protein, partial [Flavobacteriales bacterium]|nr:tandem-95 repeat protein [Flavobacteriales bacterium]
MNPSASGWDGVSNDTLGGSPMVGGPFTGFNANFDVTELILLTITPEAIDDTIAAVDPIVATTIDVAANDDGTLSALDPTTVTITTPLTGDTLFTGFGTEQGDLTIDPVTGVITFTPAGGFTTGFIEFEYTIDNMLGRTSAPATVAFIAGSPTQPHLVGDTLGAFEDVPLVIDVVADLLVNDTDLDNDIDPTSIEVTNLSSGTLVNNNDGILTFTPVLNSNGDVTFDYDVRDDLNVPSDNGPVTVTINVMAVNDPPTTVGVNFGALQNTTAALPAAVPGFFIDNDTDVDGDMLSYVSVSDPENGTYDFATNLYTPDFGFVGVDTFTYTVTDGMDTSTGTVTVNVAPTGGASFDIIGGTFFMAGVSTSGPSPFGRG